jgi:hypothetical protein
MENIDCKSNYMMEKENETHRHPLKWMLEDLGKFSLW